MPEDIKVNDNAAAAANAAAASVSDGAAQAANQAAQTIKVGGKEYSNWDEVGKAYENLQSEYGKWTNQYGQLKNQYDQALKLAEQAQKWDAWWKDIQPLWGEDVENFLRKKMQGLTSQGAQQVAAAAQDAVPNEWDGWELLRPQEQAQRLQQHLVSSLQGPLNQRLGELAKAVNDTLMQKEHWYQTYLNNHLGLMRKAFEQKLQNPSFDMDKTFEMAAQAMSGQVDPIKLGQQLIDAQTFQAKLEEARKTAYEQGKKDLEQEMKNKQAEPISASLIGGAPKFKLPALSNNGSPRMGLASLREKAAESIARNFGPQWFTGH